MVCLSDATKVYLRSALIEERTLRVSRHYGLSRSMTMVTPSTPDFTGWLVPSRSPLCGMAWPDFDRRATITTSPAPESFLDGIGLVESSSWNVKGNSFFVARTIATGIGGPLVSRANTNRVSVGDPLPAKPGATVTVPLIVRVCLACVAGWADAVDSAYGLSRSMTTVIPSTPDCIGWLTPSKSPFCGMAWPDFDRRATITTGPALESFLDGMGLVESSS